MILATSWKGVLNAAGFVDKSWLLELMNHPAWPYHSWPSCLDEILRIVRVDRSGVRRSGLDSALRGRCVPHLVLAAVSEGKNLTLGIAGILSHCYKNSFFTTLSLEHGQCDCAPKSFILMSFSNIMPQVFSSVIEAWLGVLSGTVDPVPVPARRRYSCPIIDTQRASSRGGGSGPGASRSTKEEEEDEEGEQLEWNVIVRIPDDRSIEERN